jgi:16S rRNA (cytosine1402-N4)-methyltransferase
VVLDIGVSSMQIDQAARGFSFQKDGPLDMRMEQAGSSAADLVNDLPEAALADLLYQLGEERASRRIARAIVAERRVARIETTLQLAGLIERVLPRPKPGHPHAATRSFQALRIAVNDELGELVRGLAAAERALAPGGWLAVVTFHSHEDRIVKRFLQARSGAAPGSSRHAPEQSRDPATFRLASRRAVTAGAAELAANPRARSAKLRIARRTDAKSVPTDGAALGLPPAATGGRR